MIDTLEKLEFCTTVTDQLSNIQLTKLRDFFDKNYYQANQAYLDSSIRFLRNISMAYDDGRLVGFSLADSVSAPIPQMEENQLVMLGGIGCIDPEYRRLGLFSHLASLTSGGRETVLDRVDRVLACARIAHPASFRTLRRLPSVIPSNDSPLSDWHLEVGAAIAELYGVKLKPNSLVVQGDGSPIGYPNINLDVSNEEWVPFSDVNRDEGDSLLGIAWSPTAPKGW